MSFRFMTEQAGAFMQLYRTIGNDPCSRDLSAPLMPEDKRDWLIALFRCELCRQTDFPNERISIDEMIEIANNVVFEINDKRYRFEMM